jgi:DNA-binding NarL/FixJ family response regulator
LPISSVTLFAAALLGLMVLAVPGVALRRHLRRQAALPRSTPPISILKPLCGLDDSLLENLASFAALSYPRYEVLLGLAGRLPPTILLTTFDDDAALLEGIAAGARGFLLKDVSFERLTDSIRAVARGESLILPAVTERVLKGLEHIRRDFESAELPDPLTRRETEVLRLMAGGYSNREIARALDASEGTVKNHASSILSKLGVRDRTRAVLKAIELGYI